MSEMTDLSIHHYKMHHDGISKRDHFTNKDGLVDCPICSKMLKKQKTIPPCCEELAYFRLLKERNPRAFKLMERGQGFLVVADDEPYFMQVYFMIRHHQLDKGSWTANDEMAYCAANQARGWPI
jgi:hypothetical protein